MDMESCSAMQSKVMPLDMPWGWTVQQLLVYGTVSACAFLRIFRRRTLIHCGSMATSSSKVLLPGAGVRPSPDME
eukprot:12912818-Prorocentrum_lima.AAC.1